eukprot:gene13580-19455_t
MSEPTPKEPQDPSTEKYTRVRAKKKDDTPMEENEIRIVAANKMRNYVVYALKLIQDKGHKTIMLKAMGRIIKRRVAGVYQITEHESMGIVDEWEPKEEGLEKLEITRDVPLISITLSLEPLDKSHKGYKEPIAADLVKTVSIEDIENGTDDLDGLDDGSGRSRKPRAAVEGAEGEVNGEAGAAPTGEPRRRRGRGLGKPAVAGEGDGETVEGAHGRQPRNPPAEGGEGGGAGGAGRGRGRGRRRGGKPAGGGEGGEGAAPAAAAPAPAAASGEVVLMSPSVPACSMCPSVSEVPIVSQLLMCPMCSYGPMGLMVTCVPCVPLAHAPMCLMCHHVTTVPLCPMCLVVQWPHLNEKQARITAGAKRCFQQKASATAGATHQYLMQATDLKVGRINCPALLTWKQAGSTVQNYRPGSRQDQLSSTADLDAGRINGPALQTSKQAGSTVQHYRPGSWQDQRSSTTDLEAGKINGPALQTWKQAGSTV